MRRPAILSACLFFVSSTLLAQWATNTTTGDIYNNNASGKVAIGATQAYAPLDVTGVSFTSFPTTPFTLIVRDVRPWGSGDLGAGIGFAAVYNSANALTTYGSLAIVKENGTSGDYGAAMVFGTRTNATAFNPMERMRITSTGTVGIGTSAPNTAVKLHVAGGAQFDGPVTGTNIQAHFQDVAEWVPATEEMVPGTVVVLSARRNNEVMPSATEYDTRVAGVVSAQPGIILGVGGSDKAQIATTGRVRVKVDATAQPVAIGDLLVTSNTPGTAMKSQPMAINGRQFHQPGTIIGKALEPLSGGTGEILVLLSMQ